MIRKLTETDRQPALDFLSFEPSFNAFAIGDIENFGFDTEFQDVWGEFDSDGAFRALVLRFHNNYVVCAADSGFETSSVADLLPTPDEAMMVSGKEAIVTRLAAAMDLDYVRHQHLAEIVSDADLPDPAAELSVERAIPATFEEVIELQRSIEEFRDLMGNVDAMRHNEESGTGRTLFVRRDGRVVSCASSAAESTCSAVIIGVCTAEPFRGQGLATACTSRLCRSLLDEGKSVCLFYDNPAAGRIYKRIGFRDVGRWATAMRGPRERGADMTPVSTIDTEVHVEVQA